jgi:hypothetical protein
LIAVVAPIHAFAQEGAPASLGATFLTLVETAAEVEIEPPEPEAWFPVRGTIDFGAHDARFGVWRGSHRHEGQDVFADAGTPLVAVRDGSIVETGDDGGRGNYVAIWSRDVDRTFVYLHMRDPRRTRSAAAWRADSAWARWAAPAPAGATTSTSRCEWDGARPGSRSTPCRSCAGSRSARGSLPSPWTRCSCATVS